MMKHPPTKLSSHRLLLAIILLFTAQWIVADDEQPAYPSQSMFMFDVGYASIHDSYLTPITYDGVDLTLGFETVRATHFSPDKWLWQFQASVDYNYVENNAKNNDLNKLLGDVSFDMQRRWRGVLTPHLDLSAGPMTQLRAGIIHNAANSNNPVSVRAHWNVGIAGKAAWNTHLGRKPVTLLYQAQLPVLGVFFAPEYDESYYEIYLGNHRNLAHLGWWGNRFDMTNYLGADFNMGKTVLRIGYRNRLEHWTVNNLKVHDFSHSLVLGVSL